MPSPQKTPVSPDHYAHDVRDYLAAFLPSEQMDDVIVEVAGELADRDPADRERALRVANDVLVRHARVAVDARVLVLHQDLELDVDGIALVLGLPVATARANVNEIRELLAMEADETAPNPTPSAPASSFPSGPVADLPNVDDATPATPVSTAGVDPETLAAEVQAQAMAAEASRRRAAAGVSADPPAAGGATGSVLRSAHDLEERARAQRERHANAMQAGAAPPSPATVVSTPGVSAGAPDDVATAGASAPAPVTPDAAAADAPNPQAPNPRTETPDASPSAATMSAAASAAAAPNPAATAAPAATTDGVEATARPRSAGSDDASVGPAADRPPGIWDRWRGGGGRDAAGETARLDPTDRIDPNQAALALRVVLFVLVVLALVWTVWPRGSDGPTVDEVQAVPCPETGPICVQNVRVTATVDDFGDPGEPQDTFAQNDPVALWWTFDRRDGALDSRLDVRWIRATTGEQIYSEVLSVIQSPFQHLSLRLPLAPGVYRVEVRVRDGAAALSASELDQVPPLIAESFTVTE